MAAKERMISSHNPRNGGGEGLPQPLQGEAEDEEKGKHPVGAAGNAQVGVGRFRTSTSSGPTNRVESW